jgi:RimJ/RimL family protein N-acetyltransferase
MADSSPWPVETERLLLRAATPDDWEASWRYRSLPEVGEWITQAFTDPVVFEQWFTDPDRIDRKVMIEHDGQVVGELMVRRENAWSQYEVAEAAADAQVELGWILHPDAAGRGFATEAVRAAIERCFTHLGVHRIVANCFADNEASWRLMERVGMRREAHTRRDSLHRSGRWLDGYGYALLADEFVVPDR